MLHRQQEITGVPASEALPWPQKTARQLRAEGWQLS